MSETDTAALFRIAADLDALAAKLDDGSTVCECCKLRRFNDFEQRNRRQLYETIAGRLRRTAETVRR